MELSKAIHGRITQLCSHGDDAMDDENYETSENKIYPKKCDLRVALRVVQSKGENLRGYVLLNLIYIFSTEELDKVKVSQSFGLGSLFFSQGPENQSKMNARRFLIRTAKDQQ